MASVILVLTNMFHCSAVSLAHVYKFKWSLCIDFHIPHIFLPWTLSIQLIEHQDVNVYVAVEYRYFSISTRHRFQVRSISLYVCQSVHIKCVKNVA